jgi:hypothetical protein
MMHRAFSAVFHSRAVGLAVLAGVPLIPALVMPGCKSKSTTVSYTGPTPPPAVSEADADSDESQDPDAAEAGGTQGGSVALRAGGSGSLGDPSKVIGRDWSLLRTEDIDRKVVFWCHVPSVANASNEYMDVLRSRDCLTWYIHVGAERQYVRRAVYQVSEHPAAGKRSSSGDASRVIYVSDPPGLACEEGCTSRAVIDEMVGAERATGVGAKSEAIPLAEFPVLLEWQVVAVVEPTDKPTWLPPADRRVILSGSQVIREDLPPPPAGRLDVPSLRLSVCGQQLQLVLQQLSGMPASEAALVLRVTPAAETRIEPGFQVVPLTTKTRIPITKQRVQDCLNNKVR